MMKYINKESADIDKGIEQSFLMALIERTTTVNDITENYVMV
ncbi:hypothetical protein ACVNPX_09230 [Staphylococcus aureus]